MGLQCQPYGTAVPTLWDCSATPMGLQCQPYGTAVPTLWDCSLIHSDRSLSNKKVQGTRG